MVYFKRAEFWHRTPSFPLFPDKIQESPPVPSIYSSARPELDRSPVLPGPCLHDLVVCSRSALGTAANTDTKLLIHGLFQKGRVLAQDGERCAWNSRASRFRAGRMARPRAQRRNSPGRRRGAGSSPGYSTRIHQFRASPKVYCGRRLPQSPCPQRRTEALWRGASKKNSLFSSREVSQPLSRLYQQERRLGVLKTFMKDGLQAST